MKEFDVTITETLKLTVSVEASSKEEAQQMVSDQWHAGDHILDADNFVEVEFESNDGREISAERAPDDTIEVLMVEPGQYPRVERIGSDLASLQKAVDGYIEAIYPYDDPVALICGEEAKLEGKPLNRALRDGDGDIYDIVAGKFFICGLGDENFASLPKELQQKYEEKFRQPEAFLKMGSKIMAIPTEPAKAAGKAFDAEDIRSFDGIFGVEASEWETVKDRLTPPYYEKAFLDNPADSFAIYQLRDNDNTAQLRFMNAEYLEKKGLSIEKENYAAVYAGNLDRRGDTQDRLDELYETFNLRRPEDFRGHSLSVSDIVALKQNGVVSCHYVDSRGFKALPDFLKPENYLKNAEMAMEDDYGMIDGVINNGPRKTVAELEEQAKSGKPVSLMELAQAARREQAQAARQEKKPSVLAKLCPPVNEPKKTARSRRAERELL